YWSRSMEDLQTKVGRGDASTTEQRRLDWHLAFEAQLNAEEDRSIIPIARLIHEGAIRPASLRAAPSGRSAVAAGAVAAPAACSGQTSRPLIFYYQIIKDLISSGNAAEAILDRWPGIVANGGREFGESCPSVG